MIHTSNHHNQPVELSRKAKKRLGFAFIGFIAIIALVLIICNTENYSNGERIGLITQYSNTGIVWKTWEGELHVTQTGMNSTMNDFQFSIDRDNQDLLVVSKIDSAAEFGWKVKLTYHETFAKNWFNNRGETDHFITAVEVLDKNPVANLLGKDSLRAGHIIDTIYLVIDKSR